MSLKKSDPGFLKNFLQTIGVSWRLFWDSRVPKKLKLIPLGSLAYLFWPVDLLVGPIDDAVVVFLGLQWFISLSAPYVLGTAEPPQEQKGVVEGDWREAD